jgi:hypothetical protein
MIDGFTVFVLLYGDYPELAVRCLTPLLSAAPNPFFISLRVGLNDVSKATHDIVMDLLARRAGPAETIVYASPINRRKYPMMRKMFYDEAHPVQTNAIMWFDDDTYLDSPVPPTWFHTAYHSFIDGAMFAVGGSVYRKVWTDGQRAVIPEQVWAGKMPLEPKARFVTGGWWMARTAFLQAYGYPFVELVHNGGDTLLGELVRQRGRYLLEFRDSLHINADANGQESKAARRGVVDKPLWHDGVTPATARSPHDFRITGVPVPMKEQP